MRGVDVLIVGGGPAGLAAALALRQRGARVTVADALKPPIDKACGEGLMPDSLAELARLGVTLTAEDGGVFRGIRFCSHSLPGRGKPSAGLPTLESVATARFPTAFDGATGQALGLKRTVLHNRLTEAAEEAGVDLRWNAPVQLRGNGCVLVAGEPLRYGCLVGADGQGSRVRRWAELETGRVLSRRFGFRQHYRVRPWSEYVEVHWGRSGQAYVTPVSEDEVGVATITRDPRCRGETLLDELPWLRERLAAGAPIVEKTDRERGALTTTRRLRRVALSRGSCGPVALLGDASGSADAVTGEGMAMAFRQALLLADCLADSPVPAALERYNREHPAILKLPQTMAQVMLGMDRWPAFRRRAIGVLASEPKLFARMLGVHVGAESPAHFVATSGLDLAWRLAAAPAKISSAPI
uniref:Monooxygenase, FAD-binding n=1 Tax=mine drainage metagenome TaxID=410659 RepID=E6PWQ3_9ZZZZ